jgi:protein-tyrosine-phosphatase
MALRGDSPAVRDRAGRMAVALVRSALAVPLVRRVLAARARRSFADSETVLFVCLGNICRSVYSARAAQSLDQSGRRYLSAGLARVNNGRLPPREAVASAARRGVDLNTHAGRALDRELAEQADAIYVFDAANLVSILVRTPSVARRVHFVGSLADDADPLIGDPFPGPTDTYVRCFERIDRCLGVVTNGTSARAGGRG